MINFSGIFYDSFIGKLLRFPLRLIPSNLIVRILQGPNRGTKWVVGSSTNGCWLGSYEFEKQLLISAYIRKDMVCYDIGAHVGFYTLMFAKFARKVYAFEPLPRNLNFLIKHVKLNNLDEVVQIFPVAFQMGKERNTRPSQ